MDTLKRQVSWLESFPPAIWAYFVSYLPGEQLGRLMITGATLLRQRLKSPAVVKSIELGQDFISFNSWPRFLNEFPSLDELHIHSYLADWGKKLGVSIESIPSGVRKLELSGLWKKHMLKLLGEPGGTLNISEHLPHLESLKLCQSSIRHTSWMTHSPQSLTELSIASWDGVVELPSSLIHFKAYKLTLSTPSSFVSKLPPSLESFVVTYELFGVNLVVPLLPPSSRTLNIGDRAYLSETDIAGSSQNYLERLPKSLTWFKVPSSKEINFETNPELISLLPSTLTELAIVPDFPCSAWHLLPKNLTMLSLKVLAHPAISKTSDEHGTLCEVESLPFDSLPRSITSLHFEFSIFSKDFFCGPPNVSNRSFFPPQLTSLNIRKIHLHPETAKLLPPSLTHLEIGNLCEQVCEHIPAGLKHLVAFRTLISPNLIKFLPNSLTSLELSVVCPTDCWFDYKSGKRVNSISELPGYIIHCNCSDRNFDWKDASPLPATLIHLIIFDAKELGDMFLIHQRLPNLLQVELDFEHLTDHSIRRLSPHLTTLRLPSSSKVSGKSFEFLPRCLTHLGLNNSSFIFDSEIQHLPRTLKYAFLDKAIHLTDLCIPDLPPHLEVLSMANNKKITPACLPRLPYALRFPRRGSPVDFSGWDLERGAVRKF